MEPTTIVLAVAAVAGLYMAWNIGANDVANAMGTSVGSGALTIRGAIIVAAMKCKQTVDVKNATWANTIGDPEPIAVWKDPDFDPSLSAFYYVRVLEIPTPRWTTFDAKALGVAPPESVPATIQERAWSSPIWYTPAELSLIHI